MLLYSFGGKIKISIGTKVPKLQVLFSFGFGSFITFPSFLMILACATTKLLAFTAKIFEWNT